jgi:peptidoglycan hydrolase-like protein with peptidoglycan-binding domain
MATTEPQTLTRTLHLANPLLTGPDVAELQELLEPYHPGAVDGEYGPATAGAVERAKWALGFPDDAGFATLCYAWSGADDPNGLGYSGQGYTGTLLQHMNHIPQAAVQPGDLVVWGPAPGHHVALVLAIGADPLLASHGQEKGPIAIRVSVESKYQPPPVTWLSSLR